MVKPILPLNEIKKQIQQLHVKTLESESDDKNKVQKIKGSELLAKQYVKKLINYFPNRTITEAEERQIVSNLMQNGSKEGVFRSFIEDSSFYQLLIIIS